MKVLQIVPEMNSGGVELHTLEVARHLAQVGHESLVISNGGRLVPELERCGVRHITLPVHRKSLRSIAQVLPVRNLLLSERPNVLQLSSRVPAWIGWFAWRLLPAGARPGLVTTVHGFNSVNAYSAVMTRGERVIAVSESVRIHILEHYQGLDASRVRVVPGGIDPAKYFPGFRPDPEWLARWHAERRLAVGEVVVCLPGRITRLKGHEQFFRLVKVLNEEGIRVRGIVAGDAHPKKRAYVAELRAAVAALGLEGRIEFLGHRADLREILSVSDIVFSLSTQPESFGRTALETLALGRPFVGHDEGGVGEQLREIFPAGLVRRGDFEGLVVTARSILASRPVPGPIPERFTLAAMCRGVEAVYREVAR